MLAYPSNPLLTERSIINFLVWTVGMIVGPYLAVSAVEFNFVPFGVIAAACIVFVIFGYLRDGMCLLPLIGTFIAGKFNFIPVLHPAPNELFPLALIVYYLIAYTALQRKKFFTGPLLFFIPIMTIAAIMLYHEHSFALRSTGGGREGARGGLFVVVAAIAYLCGVSVNSPSPRFLYLTPLFCIIADAIFSIPYAVTTYFPGTAPYFYIFSDNINGSAYSSEVLDTGAIVRNSAQGTLGAAVITVLLSYFPLFTWWRPQRWWIVLVSLGCVALVIMGGYRSNFAELGLTVFAALWCYYSWRALLLIPALVLGIVVLTSMHSSHAIHLPQAAQRTLAFLPGDWDPDVVDNTDASNDFRKNIATVYLREDAAKSPLFGNGVSYDAADFQLYTYLAMYQETSDGYYSTKEFVTGKMFHTGWISLYDSEGVVGFAAFLVFTLSLLWFSGRTVLQKGVNRHSLLFPLKVWMFCNIFTSQVSFFTLFGDIRASFPFSCFYAILFVHISRLEKFGYWAKVPVRQVPFDPSRTELSLPAAT